MSFERDPDHPRRLRFVDFMRRKAVIQPSMFHKGHLAWVQKANVEYLSIEDARALRDYLTTWLREQRKTAGRQP